MSNGGSRVSTVIVLCLVAGFVFYAWSQTSPDRDRSPPASAYDRPGTLATFATRLDGNATGDSVPYWAPFDDRDPDRAHGRLLESLLVSHASAVAPVASERTTRIVDPVPPPPRTTTTPTVLFFGDSNERAVVDEVCLKLGTWPTVVSAKDPPRRSDRWHADAHVCDVADRLRWASFMSYGVLVEADSTLWDKKLELEGPWAVKDRIELATAFVDQIGWERVDVVVFNSNLWDLMFLHDTHLRSKSPYEGSLAAATLERYISRAAAAVVQLAEAFGPATPVYVRTLHPLAAGREVDFFNARRVAQLNEAALAVVARAVARGFDVRVLDVARVLAGWPTSASDSDTILKDKVHLGWNPGLWMYGEMVLDAVRRSHER